jgi:hypothetical protein
MPRKPIRIEIMKDGPDVRLDFFDNFGQRLRALFNIRGRVYQRRTFQDGSTYGDDLPAPMFRLPRNTERERGYPTRYTTRRKRK